MSNPTPLRRLVARIRADTIDKVTSDKVTFNHPHPRPSPPRPLLRATAPGDARPLSGARRADQSEAAVGRGDGLSRTLSDLGWPGGMGKTRLALKAAERSVPRPPTNSLRDRLFFVPLENVSDADELVTAIISAITAES